MSQQTMQTPALDEAIALTVDYLRSAIAQPGGIRGNYGYDLWAPTVANAWALQACGAETLRRESAARRASPIFFEAAWELCRRGVLRPGIRETGGQAVSGGLGYSLTAQGREWLASGTESSFVALQPGGLAAALAKFRALFGDGYHQRAQEAVRCRDAEAWFGACAMVGAAAESIVLATAAGKTGSEDAALKAYGTANGRKKLFNDLAPATKPHLARPFATVTGLIGYWRDESTNSTAVAISGPETEQALRELLHFAQFISDNWEELTTGRAKPVVVKEPEAAVAPEPVAKDAAPSDGKVEVAKAPVTAPTVPSAASTISAPARVPGLTVPPTVPAATVQAATPVPAPRAPVSVAASPSNTSGQAVAPATAVASAPASSGTVTAPTSTTVNTPSAVPATPPPSMPTPAPSAIAQAPILAPKPLGLRGLPFSSKPSSDSSNSEASTMPAQAGATPSADAEKKDASATSATGTATGPAATLASVINQAPVSGTSAQTPATPVTPPSEAVNRPLPVTSSTAVTSSTPAAPSAATETPAAKLDEPEDAVQDDAEEAETPPTPSAVVNSRRWW